MCMLSNVFYSSKTDFQSGSLYRKKKYAWQAGSFFAECGPCLGQPGLMWKGTHKMYYGTTDLNRVDVLYIHWPMAQWQTSHWSKVSAGRASRGSAVRHMAFPLNLNRAGESLGWQMGHLLLLSRCPTFMKLWNCTSELISRVKTALEVHQVETALWF